MENAMQSAQSNVPAMPPPAMAQQVLKTDVLIPKVLQMQGISKLVMAGKARAGEFVRSTTGERLGGQNEKVGFIPLRYQDLWLIEKQQADGKYKFAGYEPRTASNETDEWEFIKDGQKMRRTKVMNLYALLPSDIEKQQKALKAFEESGEVPDVDAALMPVVLSFKVTSFKAAREVASYFLKVQSLSQDLGQPIPPYAKTLFLSNTMEQNEKGMFYVQHVDTAGARTPKEQMEKAKQWYDTLGSMGDIKIDEGDESGEEEAAAPGGPTQF